jgi:hypothetical protein
MAGRTSGLGNAEGADRGTGIVRGENPVLPVAGRASGRINFTAGHQFSVKPFLELLLDCAVALAAGLGNIEEVDRRFGFAWRQDAVGRSPGRVAVVAGGRGIHSPCGGLAMHTFLIDFDGMLELDVQVGKEFLVLVAGAARRGQVRGVHHGFRIRMGQDVMAAVALLTGGNIRGLADDTPAVLGIDLDGLLMADTAFGLGQSHGVGNPLDIAMTVRTGKILMDAPPKIGCLNF